MKLKNVTANRQQEVEFIKMMSGGKPEVSVYENESTCFIHEHNGDKQILSISGINRAVVETDWLIGIKKIMKLDPLDVVITVRPSGIVFIKEKDDSIPNIANRYH